MYQPLYQKPDGTRIPESQNPRDFIDRYFQMVETGEPFLRPIESRRNSQGPENLEGSSSSHNWEAAYSGRHTPDTAANNVITISPLLYELMIQEGHVSELLNLQVRVRRESWSHYFVRVIKHVTRIDQLP
jgi:hypothetical protein